MKKNIILPVMIVLVIIACTIFISDGPTYLVTSLMALAIIGTIQRYRSRVMKITRWAKANPFKAQVLISVLQAVLIVFGVIAGYNLKKSGYEFSGTTAFVFSTIIILGFLSVHFLPKRNSIPIPKEVNKNRLVYMSIALSSFVMMTFFGNRIEDRYPNSFITHAVQAIDQAIFPDDNTQYADLNYEVQKPVYTENYNQTLTDETNAMAVFASFTVDEKESIQPPAYSKKETKAKLKAEKKATRMEKKKERKMNRLEKFRAAFAGGLSVGAVLLIILLVGTLCGGICLIIGGFSGSAGLIPLGAVVAAGSIWGIIKLSKGSKEKDKPDL